MSEDNTTFLEDCDGPYLVGLANWIARSLDLTELSREEALTLYMILNSALSALWNTFERELTVLAMRPHIELVNQILDEYPAIVLGDEEDEEDEVPDDDNGSGGTGGPLLQ